MSRPAWVRLDNASNIFLAARSDSDPKVFRLSAEMDAPVDPDVLQEALDATFDRFPLYHAVLRQGLFWHYLQDSDLRPQVQPDVLPSCSALYFPGEAALMFRVVHRENRIALEVFHALSDGTGALWFLTELLVDYCRRREAEPGPAMVPEAAAASGPTVAPAPSSAPGHGLSADSFGSYFRRRRVPKPPSRDSAMARAFGEAAASSLQAADTAAMPAAPDAPEAAEPRRSGVLRARGTRTPDARTHAIELSMPAKQVIALAKSEGASLSMYLVALFFESVRATATGRGARAGSGDGPGAHRTLAVSVPVNLRQFFPSDSARNFFATVRLAHTYGEGDDSLAAVAADLEEQFRPRIAPEALGERLRRLIRLEQMPLLRILPWPVKDAALSAANHLTNRGLTIAISNMGRVVLPEPAEAHVRRMYLQVSAARPQFCSMSHGETLTISFTSPFVEADHVRAFARHLTAHGVKVQVAANRVREDELAQVHA